MKIITLTVLTFSSLSLFGQDLNTLKCRNDNHYQQHLANHPEVVQERAAMEAYTADFVANYNSEAKTGVKTIPVVFHVNDPSNPQKVTLAQVQSAIDILNEDFRAQNADIQSIRPEFQSVIADMEIEFCLATKDPSGNPTTGITYHYNNYNGVEPNGYGSAVKSVEYWPGEQYLNVWIVNYVFDDGSLYNSGWAYLPDTWVADNDLDGIVYNHRYLGYVGSSEVDGPSSWQAEMARVLTHEVGHYLNLHHTFENYCDSPGDYVDDTPYVYYHGSNNCEQLGTLCSSTTVVMDQNYMDYTPCPSMYSEGQKARVQAALNSSVAGRNNLWTESNLLAVGCMTDAGLTDHDLLSLTEIYPNPTNGLVQVNFHMNTGSSVSIKVLSAAGKTISSETLEVTSFGSTTLDLSDFPEGIYLVQLNSGEYEVTKRIVKN